MTALTETYIVDVAVERVAIGESEPTTTKRKRLYPFPYTVLLLKLLAQIRSYSMKKIKKKTESKVPVGCFLSFQNYTITVTIRFFKFKLDRTLSPVTQESCINLWKKRYTGGGEIAGRGLRTRRKREGEERNAT